MTSDRRAPVQGDYRLAKAAPGREPGTISWDEHVRAWEAYAQRFGKRQSAEVIADRQGFGYAELCAFLGHPPKTWRIA